MVEDLGTMKDNCFVFVVLSCLFGLVQALPLSNRQESVGSMMSMEQQTPLTVSLGPRPFWLVDDMDEGPLKKRLQSCSNGPFKKTDFCIGHRGAALQFPEHTKESYEAAARMGAGKNSCSIR